MLSPLDPPTYQKLDIKSWQSLPSLSKLIPNSETISSAYSTGMLIVAEDDLESASIRFRIDHKKVCGSHLSFVCHQLANLLQPPTTAGRCVVLSHKLEDYSTVEVITTQADVEIVFGCSRKLASLSVSEVQADYDRYMLETLARRQAASRRSATSLVVYLSENLHSAGIESCID